MRSAPLLLALVACGPKKPPAIVIDDAADLDEEVLNALVAELAPLVEEAAGREFPSVPHARLSRTSDMETILEGEFLDLMAGTFDVPDWVLRQLAEDARAGAPGIVGKYGIQTDVLYLSPEAVASVAAGTGLPPSGTGDVARLVLAHEMVHALQADVVTWRGLVDTDHLDALRATTEGHANFVEQRVAERLGLDAARRALDEGQGWNEAGPIGPGAFETWALYGQGKAFVAHHVATGGDEAAWRLLREPPSSTSMIFHPERYSPEVPTSEDFASALEGVESKLTEGAWVPIVGRTSELALRQELFGRDVAEVDAVLAGIASGTERQAYRSDRSAVLRVLRLADADAARRMVTLATTPPPREEMPDLAPDWVDTVEPFEGVEADLAVQRVSGPAHMGVDFEVTEVWVVRGDLVVQVRAEGFRPGIRLREAVQTVLARLDGP